ncbi:MAG: hypothetical protein ACYC2K_01850 [Gemmatimonadales bacterium]
MPSPADRRLMIERGLRLLASAALIGAIALSIWRKAPPPAAERQVDAASVAELLRNHDIGAEPIVVVGDTALDPIRRDWLAATQASVRWGGNRLTPTAISSEPLGDPAGGYRIAVTAPTGAMIRLADSLGLIDSVQSAGGGATIDVATPVGRLLGSVGTQAAQVRSGPTPSVRQVVVFGRASWETKFVIAALEERGWIVNARIEIGPRDESRQGAPNVLDTASVAAIVAIDQSAAAHSSRIVRFVRDGGGLILAADAAQDPVWAELRAASSGQRVASRVIDIDANDPRRALALTPMARLSPNSSTLESRDGAVAVAARRVGIGRIVQIGYHDTWRWRMTGPEGSVEAHRAWWSALVRTVSYRPDRIAVEAVSVHDAPLARMAASFGPPTTLLAETRSEIPARTERLSWLLGAVALIALLTEWASRRLRGMI